MKPGQKPYDRHSKLWLTLETVNPCNHFIVEFLMRTKIRMQKQRASQYYCYNLAVESVKKYPMPILCASQLKVIEGFGDFFVEETEKLIKKHYSRGRLPTPQEKQKDEIEEFQSLRLHMQRQKIRKSKSQEIGDQSEYDPSVMGGMSISSSKKSQDDKMESESIKFIKALKSQQSYTPSEYSVNKSLKSSVKSSKYSSQSANKVYKPKYGSEAFMVLEMVYEYEGYINKYKKGITKGEINQILFEQAYGDLLIKRILQKQSSKKYKSIPKPDRKMQRLKESSKFQELLENQEKVKSWKSIRQKLAQYQFIYFDENDNERFYLTKQGLQHVKQTLEKEKAKEKQIQLQNLQGSQKECSQGEEEKKEQKKKTTRRRRRKNDKNEIDNRSVLETHLEDCREGELNMLIDTKKLQRNYTKEEFQDFIKSLRKKVNYELTDVRFGGFMWEHKGEIINAMAAILDYSKLGEDELVFICKQMSYFREIATKIIIYEVKPNFTKSDKFLQVICEAKIKGFKIHKSHSLQDTIRILHKYYKLFQNLQKKQRIRTIGHSLRSFQRTYARTDPYLLRNIFSQVMKQFSFLSSPQQDDIEKIIEKFKGIHGFLECVEGDENSRSLQIGFGEALESSSRTVIRGWISIGQLIKDLVVKQSYDLQG